MAAYVVTPMPKKPDPDQPRDQAAKVALDVLKMARAIVAIRGGSVSKLISDTCRPHFAKIIQQMQERGEFLPPHDDA